MTCPESLDPFDMADLLDRVACDPHLRLLRHVPALDAIPLEPDPMGTNMVGIILDVETTGTEIWFDEIIELAMVRFVVDGRGRYIEIGAVQSWREDPGFSLAPEISRITGLVDDDLKGQAIDDAAVAELLDGVDFIVAHNAQFDARFFEKRFPKHKGLAWICSCHEMDWPKAGFEGRSQSHLLMQMGWFYPPHSAGMDVTALATLLGHRLPDNIPILSHILRRAMAPCSELVAVNAPYAKKDQLKRAGYRWDPDARAWWIELPDHEVDAEHDWLKGSIYEGYGAPIIRPIDWTLRHRPHPKAIRLKGDRDPVSWTAAGQRAKIGHRSPP